MEKVDKSIMLDQPRLKKKPLDNTKHSSNKLPTLYQQQQQARLQYFHHRQPVYVEKPSFGLNDFELQDTLGELMMYLYTKIIMMNRYWHIWKSISN